MFKIVVGVCVFCVALFGGDRIEIKAQEMEAVEQNKRVVFTGEAHMTQDQSWIKAKRLIVYFDDNNETERFEAKGSVSFVIKADVSHYKGKCERLEYFPKKEEYKLYLNARVIDVKADRIIEGEKIHINAQSGDAYAVSNGKKPVKVIFQTGENK